MVPVQVSAFRKQTCIQTLPWFKKRFSCYFHKNDSLYLLELIFSRNVPAHKTTRIFTGWTAEPSSAKTKRVHCILTAFSEMGFTTLDLQSVFVGGVLLHLSNKCTFIKQLLQTQKANILHISTSTSPITNSINFEYKLYIFYFIYFYTHITRK